MKKIKISGNSAFWLGNIAFGLTIPLTKLIYKGLPLNLYLLPKYLIAGVIVWLLAKYSRDYKKLSSKQYLTVFGLGLLNVTLCNLLFYFALEKLPATYSLVGTLLSPIVIYILAVMVLKQKVHFKALTGILVSFAGVALLFLGSHVEHGVTYFSLLGLVVLLLSIIVSAYGTVLSKPFLQDIPALQFIGLQLLLGSLIFVPQFILSFNNFNFAGVPMVSFVTLGLLCFVITPFAFIGYFVGIKSIDVEDSAAQLYLQAVVGVVGSVLILGEKLTNLYVASMVVIMLGIWIGKANIAKVWIELQRPRHLSVLELIKGAIKRLNESL